MARSEARLRVEIWNDPDFRTLSRDGQWLYMFLLSQVDLAHDGTIPLRERRWSKSNSTTTTADIERDLKELEARRYLVIDWDAEEVLLRSFIRRDKVYRQPNVLRAAADHLPLIASPIIRAALAVEIARVTELDDQPKDTPAILAEMLAELGVSPASNPQGNPSGTLLGASPDAHPALTPMSDSPGTALRLVDGTSICGNPDTDETLQNGASKTAGQNPQRNPSGNPPGGAPGERGEGTAVTKEFPESPGPGPRVPVAPPFASLTAAPARDNEPPADSDTGPGAAERITRAWISSLRKQPQRRIVNDIGKAVSTAIAEGQDPTDVAEALRLWQAKGTLGVNALPGLIHQVANAAPLGTDLAVRSARASPDRRPSTTDDRVNAVLALRTAGGAI